MRTGDVSDSAGAYVGADRGSSKPAILGNAVVGGCFRRGACLGPCGTCRDVPGILDVGYPMWSTARFMRTGKDRVQLRAVQVPLLVDGVTIHPGDWVCADADGALVMPADRVHEVIEAAQRIERTEEAITNAVLAGSTLTQARATHGYHALQTPTANASRDTRSLARLRFGHRFPPGMSSGHRRAGSGAADGIAPGIPVMPRPSRSRLPATRAGA